MALPHPSRLGVCSWSLRPASVDALIVKVQQATALGVQLALEPIRTTPERWAETGARLLEAGLTLYSGMFQPAGEDYTTPATIRATGGLVPDATWEENQRRAAACAHLARDLELPAVSFHAGFIPEDPHAPAFQVLVKRVRWVADCFRDTFGGEAWLETGQETAAGLNAFLDAVDRPTVGVNLDPANLLLYDTDNPITAIETLQPRIRQVHLKDARRPDEPGPWGEEVVLGTGEVDWRRFLTGLERSDFHGELVVEREAGDDRVGDVQIALTFIADLLEELD